MLPNTTLVTILSNLSLHLSLFAARSGPSLSPLRRASRRWKGRGPLPLVDLLVS
jgi:hypothetical protein